MLDPFRDVPWHQTFTVRKARTADEPLRIQIVNDTVTELFWDTFIYFLFQEATLQGIVLGGAVAFIFLGWSVSACMFVVPALAAAGVACAVWAGSAARAASLAAAIRAETAGWVAEHLDCPIGTISLTGDGRVRALAVHRHHRRQGVASKLLATAVAHARTEQHLYHYTPHLEVRVAALQHRARELFYRLGWELRGTYSAPCAGGVVSLLVAVLTFPLPAPA